VRVPLNADDLLTVSFENGDHRNRDLLGVHCDVGDVGEEVRHVDDADFSLVRRHR